MLWEAAGVGRERDAGVPLGGAREPRFPPPRGRLHLAVFAVKLGKEGKAAFCPFCLLLDRKSILFAWKFSLEMQVPGWQRFVSLLEINRKRKAEQTPFSIYNVALNNRVSFGLCQLCLWLRSCTRRLRHPKAPQGTPRHPRHCHKYQQWYWGRLHVIHQLLCHLSEPQEFWTASELINLKIFYTHHSAPIPSNSISIVTED